jgi:hypothetical protein
MAVARSLQRDRFGDEVICVPRMEFAHINGHRKKSHRSRSKALRVIVHGWVPPDLVSRTVTHMTVQWLLSGGLKPTTVSHLPLVAQFDRDGVLLSQSPKGEGAKSVPALKARCSGRTQNASAPAISRPF